MLGGGKNKRWFRAIVVIAGCLLVAGPVWAVDTYWQVESGNWLIGTNWTAGTPNSEDAAHINNGGTASITSFVDGCRELGLGEAAGESGTVDINGGDLNVSEWICIGNQGTGILHIYNDANFSHPVEAYIRVGLQSTGDGNVVVSGAGSIWTWPSGREMWVGIEGRGSVTVQDSGEISGGGASIGSDSTGDGSITVTGAGSSWTNSGGLWVAELGTAELSIENGGAVSTAYAEIGSRSDSNGSVTVTGTGSTLSHSEYLFVGTEGTGSMTIQSGGAVSNLLSSCIGCESGSDGSVIVDGDGSVWVNSASLYVGGGSDLAGGAGELTVANDGYVFVSDTLKTWDSGKLSIADGVLDANVVEFGGSGSTLNITAAGAEITVSGLLHFGDNSSFMAVPGSTIHLTGADFENLSTDETGLAGLANLELIFEGGPGKTDDLEVACEDKGAVVEGYDNNFAHGKLTIGGADVGMVRLVDNCDNGNRGGEGGNAEALYVDSLELGAGSVLDLNNLHLFWRTEFINNGGTILNGDVCQVEGGTDWWPMFRHNPNHTGYSNSAAPDTNNVLWAYTTGGAVHSSPAVVDGKAYVGSDDFNVYCLDVSTGAKIWSYTTSGPVYSSPAVVDGNVYVDANGGFYCLPVSDPNGDGVIDDSEVTWTYPMVHYGGSSPAFADGNVYAVLGGDAYCLPQDDPNGDGVVDPCEVIWSYGLTGGGSPAVAEGNVYVGSDVFYCLNASTGAKVWTYTPPGDSTVLSSAAVADGKVYVATSAGVDCLPASDPNGDGVIDQNERIWIYRAAADVFESSPAVAYGKVYVQSHSGWVFCLPADDPNGDGIIDSAEVEWKHITSGGWPMYARSSAAVADDKVYIGADHYPTGGGSVYCLPPSDPNGDGTIDENELIWRYQIATVNDVGSSPAVADGKVCVGADDGKIYCLGLGSLHLLSPNGEEGLLAGANYSIQWETLDTVNDVLIRYSADDGSTWTAVAPPNTGNSGAYNWLVPILTSDRCLVRISDANDANDIDTSDYTFGICECQRTIPADLNHDCYVDLYDLDIFVEWWLESGCSEPNWCDRTDFDKSSSVDCIDFAAFAYLWAQCGNAFDPTCGTPPPWQDCWNCPYQCHGDADCAVEGLFNYRVYTNDLYILVTSWMKSYGQAGYNPCADFDRDGDVDWDDEEILETWWMMPDVPADCPTE